MPAFNIYLYLYLYISSDYRWGGHFLSDHNNIASMCLVIMVICKGLAILPFPQEMEPVGENLSVDESIYNPNSLGISE